MAKQERNDNARLQAAIGEIVEILERYDVGAIIALAAGDSSESCVHFSQQSLFKTVRTADGVQIDLTAEAAHKPLKKRTFESRVKFTDQQINMLCYLAQYHYEQLLPFLGPKKIKPRPMRLMKINDLERHKPESVSPEDLPPTYWSRKP